MSIELFDAVNLQDEVIGTTDKIKAHASGQLHRVAAVYVFDKQGRLYVQVHKKSGGLYDHSVGGHISKGETYAEGAAREAREELGITQPLEELAIFYSDEGPEFQHMFGLYTCVAEPSWEFIPNDEVDEIILMDLTDIRELMASEPEKFTGGFINTMNEYVRLKN
jgi:isopentenyl-diphosphate delta-isomerase